MATLTFDDYRERLNIQEVLIDAGYTLNRRDGLRYPSYVKLDDDGRRVRGDKFLVTANGNCCFKPPERRLYSVTSFIMEHPELFTEYHAGMKEGELVHRVCRRLLNEPIEERDKKVLDPKRDGEPFRLDDYTLHAFKGDDKESQKVFYPYFKSRGLSLSTQFAFHKDFVLAERTNAEGNTYRALSFPMRKPETNEVVGFEQRGRPNAEGKAYKGMAPGTNASEGLWLGSPNQTALKDAKRVFVFESVYDAMAFYQLLCGKDSNLTAQEKKVLRDAVYASTGGNPSVGQIQGLLKNAPNAIFHLGFDNDPAGIQFTGYFKNEAASITDRHVQVIREEPSEGYKDFNDEVLKQKKENVEEQRQYHR